MNNTQHTKVHSMFPNFCRSSICLPKLKNHLFSFRSNSQIFSINNFDECGATSSNKMDYIDSSKRSNRLYGKYYARMGLARLAQPANSLRFVFFFLVPCPSMACRHYSLHLRIALLLFKICPRKYTRHSHHLSLIVISQVLCSISIYKTSTSSFTS